MTQAPLNFTNATPRIAALEISGRQGSIAVALGPNLLVEKMLSPTARHAVELMPALDQLCRQAGWIQPAAPNSPLHSAPHSAARIAPLQHIYLSLGPGSFTGLRIAVAVARALAQAVHCQIIGVPSLDVIAQNAPAEFPIVVPILDAKRGQVFAARYERSPHGELMQTAGAALVEPASFLADAATRGTVAVLGEGIEYHHDAIKSLHGGRGVEILDRSLWFGRAATVHRLGYAKALRGEFADPRTLLPIYIRLPEAEEVWRKKHGLPLA